MRVLGLDIGAKRIGVAVSDLLGLTAQGVETLECRSPEIDVKRIAELVETYQVTEIVVGVPYNMNGTAGPQAEKVRVFADLISEAVGVPIREWDERLTTVAAERVLVEADMSRRRRRKVVDKVAAVLILQGYLDMQTSREGDY